MLRAWQAGDCSDQPPFNGDFELAMKSIKAKTLVLPGKTDLYFPPEDSSYEVACMTPGVGSCVPFPSIWGHWYVHLHLHSKAVDVCSCCSGRAVPVRIPRMLNGSMPSSRPCWRTEQCKTDQLKESMKDSHLSGAV